MRSDISTGLSKTYAWIIELGLEQLARVLQLPRRAARTQGAPGPLKARVVQILGYQR
jgi:hypothetical protein